MQTKIKQTYTDMQEFKSAWAWRQKNKQNSNKSFFCLSRHNCSQGPGTVLQEVMCKTVLSYNSALQISMPIREKKQRFCFNHARGNRHNWMRKNLWMCLRAKKITMYTIWLEECKSDFGILMQTDQKQTRTVVALIRWFCHVTFTSLMQDSFG